MVTTHSQQNIIKRIKIFWAFIHYISTLIPTLRVKKPIKIINKNRIDAKRRQAKASHSNSDSKRRHKFKQKWNDSPNCMPRALLLKPIRNMQLFGNKYLLLPPKLFQNSLVFCTNMIFLIPLILLLDLPQLFSDSGYCALNLIIFFFQGFRAFYQKEWQACHAVGLVDYF